jgi:hypothetical protein
VIIHVGDLPSASQPIQNQPVVRTKHARFAVATWEPVIDGKSIVAPAKDRGARGVSGRMRLFSIGQRVVPS